MKDEPNPDRLDRKHDDDLAILSEGIMKHRLDYVCGDCGAEIKAGLWCKDCRRKRDARLASND